MRKGSILFGVLILTLTLGLVACGGGEDPTPTPTTAPPTATPTQGSGTGSGTGTGGGTGGGAVLKVLLTENPYTFVPDTFDLSVGTTYTLKFPAPAEFHTFTVSDLGIDVSIFANEAVEADVTPGTAGSFELVCVPHIALGMVGTVTVS